jgi:hypothetical protein
MERERAHTARLLGPPTVACVEELEGWDSPQETEGEWGRGVEGEEGAGGRDADLTCGWLRASCVF